MKDRARMLARPAVQKAVAAEGTQISLRVRRDFINASVMLAVASISGKTYRRYDRQESATIIRCVVRQRIAAS